MPSVGCSEENRGHSLRLRRPDRKQPAADTVFGTGRTPALQRMVRPPPLPRPRTHQNHNGIPEGWNYGVVSDFYSTASGGTPSRKNPDFYMGVVPWVKTQELTGGFILSTEEKITEEAIKLSSAKLLPRHTVLVAMYGATIGQTSILSVPATTNQACCAVIPSAPGTTFSPAYLFLNHFKKDLVGLGQGAAQKNISQQVIKAFKIVLPSKALLDTFSESVNPLFDQIEILQKMNINLTKARDLLLPRLMNGELII